MRLQTTLGSLLALHHLPGSHLIFTGLPTGLEGKGGEGLYGDVRIVKDLCHSQYIYRKKLVKTKVLFKLAKVLTVAIPGCEAPNNFERLQVEDSATKIESNLLEISTESGNISVARNCMQRMKILLMKSLVVPQI